MGTRGPIPNRSEDLSRERDVNNKRKDPLRKGDAKPFEWYPAPADWHPTCIRMWESVPNSGIYEFYQESDLAMLHSLLEDLSAAKLNGRGGVPPAMLITAVYNQLNNFGFSEGDRRRMRIELETPQEETSSVEEIAMSAYQEALGVNVIELPRDGRYKKAA